MTLLVDTSVWSLALRGDGSTESKEVTALRNARNGADAVVTTDLVLEELPQGFSGLRDRKAIVERFGALPLIQPCSRRSISDPPCRFNSDPGVGSDLVVVGCG